ncbi:protease [Betaproteobacteria bacterium]|nr:protease [Betaproteobacteria bacterium]GHU44056.1 protease [Betaproteobacteria bacterium]
MTPRPLELLAPAKNADFGIEAILHGADAVYIGGQAFGARASAGNGVADIHRLASVAHRYDARVFAAVNTILTDAELEPARRLIWQLYEAGVDAVIVQDMGLLELDLPPVQLHASTQTDIRTPEKARFLDRVGFSQLVLARELSLPQIRRIADVTTSTLEFFIHGALCVAYSGQCYISHAHTGRSANRGECSQACRLPYNLADGEGRIIAMHQHLLSMKDNDQSANLLQLAEAGVGAFKIEGRLKDLSYVKNITAHYRVLLDEILTAHPDRFCRASSGHCRYTFTPQPEKTFNRGGTDYFVNGRQADIGAFATPAFVGVALGHIRSLGANWFELEAGDAKLHNGDGLAYLNAAGEAGGMRVNTVERQGNTALWRCVPQEMPADLQPDMPLYRNHDQAFERLLEKTSAERRILLDLVFAETRQGFSLTLTDETGIRAEADFIQKEKTPTRDPERAAVALREHLGKLGATRYQARDIHLVPASPSFLPVSAINALRREAVANLDTARAAAYRRPPRKTPAADAMTYPESALSYLGNVHNQKARDFYHRHGVAVIDAAFEAGNETGEVALMTTRHCLRYSFNLCPKEVKGLRPDPLTLVSGKEKFTLVFDCKQCEMRVLGRKKRHIPIQAEPTP